MLDEWWDTDEYRKRFVPYHTARIALLYEWCSTCPTENMTRFMNLMLSWYDLGEALDREYRFRMENGYPTDEIEEAIGWYTECSAILAERFHEHHAERLVPSVGHPVSG